MAALPKGIYIVGAKRTAFGRFGGRLRAVPASHAFAAAAKDAFKAAELDPKNVDSVIVGNVNFLSQCDGGKTARYCGLYSGVPIERPALCVNKACASGLQAVINGALDILTGVSKICLTGGTENMTTLPLIVRNVRFGTTLGSTYELQEYISKQTLDSYSGLESWEIAERVANKYEVTREMSDEYVLESHQKWTNASEAGHFKSEISPVTIREKNEDIEFESDEVPNPTLTLSMLAGIPGNIVTAGNSSSPGDGAAALVIANEEAIQQHNWVPLAKVVGWTCVGTDPEDAGLGAMFATEKLLQNNAMVANDVDLFEINETFASQVLASIKALKLDKSKVNVNGGALAVGNPVAATGARMVTHLVHQLRRQGLGRGIASSSAGGGQGVAVMIEIV